MTQYAVERPRFCAFCAAPLPAEHVGLADTLAMPTPAAGVSAVGRLPDWIGEFKPLAELGRGGMGVVYEAEQAGTGRRVALKVLSPDLPKTRETVARFLREASMAAAVSHPRSTFVFGAGEVDGQQYIAMELMPGPTLKDVVDREGPLPIARAVDYILDAIDGLIAAHAVDVIHRDVKPSNCFLDGDGRVKVGDFGLSKSLVADTALTQSGTFLGTILFAAPEQLRSGELGPATDQYAVGATLFYLIAGRPPFIGDAAAVIAQVASESATLLGSVAPDVPNGLERIIAKALARDPTKRFRDLGQLREALLPYASGGTSIADLGRRLAAFMLETFAVSLAANLLVLVVAAVFVMLGPDGIAHWLIDTSDLIADWFIPILYFAICEGVWGRGFGKRMFGLRTIGGDGEPPGIARAALRALFIPGTLGLPWLLRMIPEHAVDAVNLAIFAVPYLSAELLCCVTMRAANGYRGLHELASGTRVVRVRRSQAATRIADLPILATSPVMVGRMFGPFRVTGKLGVSGQATVLEARDDVLDRPVWIFLHAPDSQMATPARVALSRPGRLRWLQGGTSDEGRWEAFESLDGSPLIDLARRGVPLGWGLGRHVLAELAEELAAAAADGTLPERLAAAEVWIDGGGRVKLLDRPLTIESAVAADQSGLEATSPVELLRRIAKIAASSQVVPRHASDLLAELDRRAEGQETLRWAAGRLAEVAERPAGLGWDDRLGIIAVSMGTEWMVLVIAMTAVTSLVWEGGFLEGWYPEPTLVLTHVATIAGLGAWFRGGPVFHFLGIEVLRLDGRPAGRLRCAWRMVVAWLPWWTAYAMIVAVVAIVESPGFDEQTGAIGQAATGTGVGLAFGVLGLFIGLAMIPPLWLAGAVFAVASPRRGLQDWLAGTCLTPK